jgi:hypothetical protein
MSHSLIKKGRRKVGIGYRGWSENFYATFRKPGPRTATIMYIGDDHVEVMSR